MIMYKILKIYYKDYSTLGEMSCKMIGLTITMDTVVGFIMERIKVWSIMGENCDS